MNGNSLVPAAQLKGKSLPNGWTVIDTLGLPYNGTGGNFGFGYIVQNESGERAHLKALDYSRALRAPDPAKALQQLTEAFNHERFILEECRGKKLANVIRFIEDGKVDVTTPTGPHAVQYLICEFATEGDIRRYIETQNQSVTWVLNCLHSVAVGIEQLHSVGIAHQDIKPSNVLVFDEFISKVGDLGRASKQGKPVMHDALTIAADPHYAPPEQAYGAVPGGFGARRMTTDFYHLGSLISFFFTQTNANALLYSAVHQKFHPNRTNDPYPTILPVLVNAFSENIQTVTDAAPEEIKEQIGLAFQYLCHPDPLLRGHPAERAGPNRLPSLQRIISMIDLARKLYSAAP